ncbi:MAG: hypothetical protein ACE5PO_09210, partial [Candidatus Bathyarchaeia archaeon]
MEVRVERVDDSFAERTIVRLEKEGQVEIVESGERDVLEFALHLQSIPDLKGEKRFVRVKDLNRYFNDIDHLADEDNSKLRHALAELNAGRFRLDYDPDALMEELFATVSRPAGRKFGPLKRDYHYVVATYLLHSQRIMTWRQELLNRRPHVKRFIDACEAILAAFRRTGIPIKDFHFYRYYADYNLPAMRRRLDAQSEVISQVVSDLIDKGTLTAKQAVPKLLAIYKTVVEVSAPVLNILRVGLELQEGIPRPEKQKGLTENIIRLRTDATYGSVFRCLDSYLRHAEAHAAYEIRDKKVLVLDHRGKGGKVIASY